MADYARLSRASAILREGHGGPTNFWEKSSDKSHDLQAPYNLSLLQVLQAQALADRCLHVTTAAEVVFPTWVVDLVDRVVHFFGATDGEAELVTRMLKTLQKIFDDQPDLIAIRGRADDLRTAAKNARTAAEASRGTCRTLEISWDGSASLAAYQRHSDYATLTTRAADLFDGMATDVEQAGEKFGLLAVIVETALNGLRSVIDLAVVTTTAILISLAVALAPWLVAGYALWKSPVGDALKDAAPGVTGTLARWGGKALQVGKSFVGALGNSVEKVIEYTPEEIKALALAFARRQIHLILSGLRMGLTLITGPLRALRQEGLHHLGELDAQSQTAERAAIMLRNGTDLAVLNRRSAYANSMFGKDHHEEDAKYLRMNHMIEEPNCKDPLPKNWKRLSDADLRRLNLDPSLLEDKKTGFLACVYQGPDGQLVVAFKGTDMDSDTVEHGHDSGLDFAEDANGAFSYSEQQANVQAIVSNLRSSGHLGDTVFTGYSLGGRHAATAAIASGQPAVTFNAAGMSDESLSYYEGTHGQGRGDARDGAAAGQIRNYHTHNDPLTWFQLHVKKIHDPMGTNIDLGDDTPAGEAHFASKGVQPAYNDKFTTDVLHSDYEDGNGQATAPHTHPRPYDPNIDGAPHHSSYGGNPDNYTGGHEIQSQSHATDPTAAPHDTAPSHSSYGGNPANYTGGHEIQPKHRTQLHDDTDLFTIR